MFIWRGYIYIKLIPTDDIFQTAKFHVKIHRPPFSQSHHFSRTVSDAIIPENADGTFRTGK
jgi:hypothetical protein